MTNYAMKIKNLTKKYGDFTAVKNLSLDIEKGEIFGLLGPNGAGKSTTIRTCLGLLSKTEGEIEILGLDSHKDAIEIRKRTGYLPGEFGLLDGISVYTYLKYLLRLSSVKSDEKLKDLAKRLDLDLKRKTNELSKGNKQKVGVVQALMADQEFIILDEPTGGLDPLMQQIFYEILREEKEAGKTVFMSSHVLAEVETVCNRVAIIKEAELILNEHISTLQDMTGKVLEVEFRHKVDPSAFEIEGVTDIEVDDRKIRMTVTKDIDQVVKRVADHRVINMNLSTYSLEKLFLRYYSNGGVVENEKEGVAIGGGVK
ncbi:MAG: ABC transporter ATP-binding protein [Thermoplasmata archaeon]|nr:MAG: ABC transporter ATP-binding protein [Thermoplasmata archaeon]